MAQQKYPFEEHTRVVWVPEADDIADIAAPTVAELNAGTDLTCLLTKDGLAIGGNTNAVDAAALCSRVDSQAAGSVGYSPQLKFFRYTDEDPAWDLVAWGDTGYLVVRGGPDYDAAWAAGQQVEVYKAQFGEKIPADSATNAMRTFVVSLFVDVVDQDAVVAAS